MNLSISEKDHIIEMKQLETYTIKKDIEVFSMEMRKIKR